MSRLKHAADSQSRFLLLRVRTRSVGGACRHWARVQALCGQTGVLEGCQGTAALLLYRYTRAMPGHRRTEGITGVQALC